MIGQSSRQDVIFQYWAEYTCSDLKVQTFKHHRAQKQANSNDIGMLPGYVYRSQPMGELGTYVVNYATIWSLDKVLPFLLLVVFLITNSRWCVVCRCPVLQTSSASSCPRHQDWGATIMHFASTRTGRSSTMWTRTRTGILARMRARRWLWSCPSVCRWTRRVLQSTPWPSSQLKMEKSAEKVGGHWFRSSNLIASGHHSSLYVLVIPKSIWSPSINACAPRKTKENTNVQSKAGIDVRTRARKRTDVQTENLFLESLLMSSDFRRHNL